MTPTRIVLDTMVMEGIALAGIFQANKTHIVEYQNLLQKLIKKGHTVILSNRLISQYLSKMKEKGIPAEYFLRFLENNLEANRQLKRISDALAQQRQVEVDLPTEDKFLAQIALACNPNNFDVFIISNEQGIYKKDRQLQRKHNIRALTPSDYIEQYC
jgi:hypothetical protein